MNLEEKNLVKQAALVDLSSVLWSFGPSVLDAPPLQETPLGSGALSFFATESKASRDAKDVRCH